MSKNAKRQYGKDRLLRIASSPLEKRKPDHLSATGKRLAEIRKGEPGKSRKFL